MIELKGVTKSFGKKLVLDNISLKIKSGETLFVLGKSGVGKSVLLKNIVGLLQPDEGEIWIEGKEVTQLSEEELVGVRRNCGMVFQFPALLDSLTVYENIAFGLNAHGIGASKNEKESLVIERLRQVGLKSSLLKYFPSELSFGVQKRVSIARTLAISPKYLLFDEPTTGMDPVVTASLNQLIIQLAEDLGVTNLVVSHDLASAFTVADRIVLLEEGRVIVDGPVSVFRESKEPLARAFLSDGILE